jgi:hypothetical protein
MASTNPPDVERLTETLDRHRVDYLLVGGLATRAYGATRSAANLDRLAGAR